MRPNTCRLRRSGNSPSALNGAYSIAVTLVPDIVAVNLSDEITAPVTVFIHFVYRKFLYVCQLLICSTFIRHYCRIDLTCMDVINPCVCIISYFISQLFQHISNKL